MDKQQQTEILQLSDVQLLVDTFYDRVRSNELLAPVFNERIQDRWPEHLDKMYRFWQTILLGEYTYSGAPFVPHAHLPVEHIHFATWMALFTQTVDELFTGEKAKEAKWRAGKMAEMFEYKIKYIREHGGKPLI